MRFVFEDGGRSGCRSCEALADYMETFEEMTPPKTILDNATLTLLHAGEIWVDFSPSQTGKGELFRTPKQQWSDWVIASNVGKTLRDVAAAYWVEAEGIALRRAVGIGSPPAPAARL